MLNNVNETMTQLKQKFDEEKKKNELISENVQPGPANKLEVVNKHSLVGILNPRSHFKYILKQRGDVSFPLIKDRNFT